MYLVNAGLEFFLTRGTGDVPNANLKKFTMRPLKLPSIKPFRKRLVCAESLSRVVHVTFAVPSRRRIVHAEFLAITAQWCLVWCATSAFFYEPRWAIDSQGCRNFQSELNPLVSLRRPQY